MIGRTALLAAALAAALLAVPAIASAQAPAPQPRLESAAAAIVVDARDGTILYAKSPDTRRAIASTTKLMTALLTLERLEPDDVLPAADYRPAAVESKIDLRPGERMRVSDLLEALMLESANDAAATLAEGVSGSREAFVRDMNARAAELGLDDTRYANPIGLDAPGNYSTARDLATLARHLLRNPRFARIVDLPSARLESGARPRTVANRNDLIAVRPFVDGVKTGYTSNAGYVLVGSATGSSGARVVSVVLGEPSEAARDASSLELLRFGLGQFRRVPALRRAKAVATAEVEYYGDRTVRLVPARGVTVLLRRGQRLERRVRAPEKVRGELDAGAPVGRVAVLVDGEPIRRVRVVVAEGVPGAGLPRRIASTLGLGLTLVVLLGMVSVVAFMGMRVSRRRRARSFDARRRTPEAAGPSGAAEGHKADHPDR